jgi:hypothetical protein
MSSIKPACRGRNILRVSLKFLSSLTVGKSAEQKEEYGFFKSEAFILLEPIHQVLDVVTPIAKAPMGWDFFPFVHDVTVNLTDLCETRPAPQCRRSSVDPF